MIKRLDIVKVLVWFVVGFIDVVAAFAGDFSETLDGVFNDSSNTRFKVANDWRAANRDDQGENIPAPQERNDFIVLVYEDLNQNGEYEESEPTLGDVVVSNGREVVRTGNDGSAILEAESGMSVFVTKPAGFELPVDEYNVPKFSYHHLPEGSPPLRFGGLAPTGELPERIEFPLIRGEYKESFQAVIMGDTQPSSNKEVSYVRDSLAKELTEMNDLEFVMIEGDVLGDDLGLFPRFKQTLSVVDAPQYYVPGNHDLDLDAKDDLHSLDTFKREWGPTYYSFDIGEVHFVILDNVNYPCNPEDNKDGRHEFCDNPDTDPSYNGIIPVRQMEWLTNDLAQTDEDKLVVVSMHIPPVTYVSDDSSKHQTDNVEELYDLLEGRNALLLSGHTHTIEHLQPGEYFSGWEEAVDAGPTPVPQIITGAGGGSWWSGDFDGEGVPEAYQRLGAPRGYFIFDFNGSSYQERFKASGKSKEKQIAVSLLSPTFSEWYETILTWLTADASSRSPTPPLNINDLPDTKILTGNDLSGGSYLMANVWNGSRDSTVSVKIDQRDFVEMIRTQEGGGSESEEIIDPFAIERQMYVFRYAARSESGIERNQGFEIFGGYQKLGPADPQPLPEWMLAKHSNHLWQIEIPGDLEQGTHTAMVSTQDAYGNEYRESFVFEIMDERPEPLGRVECLKSVALGEAGGIPSAECQ